MELKVNRAALTAAGASEQLMQEQSVELDYVLPDYYPDVCKLVKCIITPAITAESIHGDRISYELRADVRILYCSEESHILQCVTQTLQFSRSMELGMSGEGVTAELCPVTEHVVCRAVSRRRLEVHGTVNVRIRTQVRQMQEVITGISGKNIQLRRIPVQYPAKSIHRTCTVFLSEELELGTAKPPVLHIVRCDAQPVEQSHKIVSGKLLAQGELDIHLLYACQEEGDARLEPMAFRIPYSQLIEMEELEEDDICHVRTTTAVCEIKPVTDANGDVRVLRCEAELRLACHAVRMSSESLVCDAFSTEHPSRCTTASLVLGNVPVPFSELHVSTVKLPCTDGAPDCVYDAWCEVKNLTAQTDAQEVQLTGMLCCFALIRQPDGMPRLLEREEPFEHRFAVPELSAQDSVQAYACVHSCAYTLSGQEELTIKAEIRLEGEVCRSRSVTVLTELDVDETTVHPRDYALKLYFGRSGEAVWDIARRCHTSETAIMEENELTEDVLTESGMLLIPIVHSSPQSH